MPSMACFVLGVDAVDLESNFSSSCQVCHMTAEHAKSRGDCGWCCDATASLLVQHMSMCMCKTTKADNSHDDCSWCIDAGCFVFVWHGSLALDGAHHGNKATNSNREYSEHVFTIAMNIFAMRLAMGLFCMYEYVCNKLTMKVEKHSHVVISFSSIKHART